MIRPGRRLPVFAVVAGALALPALLSPLTIAVWMTDGLYALAVLGAAAGWGAWPAVWLGHGRREPLRQVCTAASLGCGWLAFAALGTGCAGWLNGPVAWGLVAGGLIAGLGRLVAAAGGVSQRPAEFSDTDRPAGSGSIAWAGALALIFPLAVLLFGASLPPGVLWTDEARGYDVLEYHLQAPREYFAAGRIHFLPHNVYASFPQQMEMLYLLLMYLLGDPHGAAIPAQMLHALCTVLAVVALVAWAPPGAARWLVALAAGTTPWLAYVGCLAYVEGGMLLFAAVAAGMIREAVQSADGGGKLAATAGLCAGLAGGCKYTALAMVAAAGGAALVAAMRGGWRRRAGQAVRFAATALAAFSPWLARNAAMTGNPVYPFAYSWFGGTAWSAGQQEQWARGHRLPQSEAARLGRVGVAMRELFGRAASDPPWLIPSLYGVALPALAAIGISCRPGRLGWLAVVWTIAVLLVWGLWTHMPGRFALPVVVPLVLLAGHAAGGGRVARALAVVVALLGGAAHAAALGSLVRGEDLRWQKGAGVSLAALVGRTDVLVAAHPLNAVLPAGAYAWLVGDAAVFYVRARVHYTVVFSRDPWLELAARGESPAACLAWLRQRGVTHVVFSWAEIERLRRTYGFAEAVAPGWVAELVEAGLTPVPADLPAGVEVYALP